MGELYGIERLIQSAARAHSKTASEAAAAIVSDLKAHIGAHKVHDDITLVVVKHR
jgi:sigma-B regulation protein RsbU (phosphoserine phosphatase)